MKLKRIDFVLIILCFFLILSYYLIEKNKIIIDDPLKDIKIEAALLMQRAMGVLKEERIKKGIIIDKAYDLNETGMIGYEISGITTTLGSLEAKRTSTNPNFAAVVVDMLASLKIKEGDWVAVNLSGSFPALNLAVLSALQTLRVNPIIVSSIGSSTWGANIPEMTYPDMELILYNQGIFNIKSDAVSIGGAGDVGKDMDQAVLEDIVARLRKNGVSFIGKSDYEKSLKQRIDFYFNEGRNIKLFINVGGNILSMGNNPGNTYTLHGIINSNKKISKDADGLIAYFLNKGIPVISLLNVKKIVADYGLPFDPVPMQKIGDGKIYCDTQYPVLHIFLALFLVVLTLLFFRVKVRGKYDT